MSGIRLFCYLRRFFRLLLSLLLVALLLSACSSKSSTDSGAGDSGTGTDDPLLEATLALYISAAATVFEVVSTEGFPITGTLTFLNEKEDVTYTGLTPTSFHNVKRGSQAVDHAEGAKMVLVKMADPTTATSDKAVVTDSLSGLVIGGLALFGSQWVKDAFFGNSPAPAVPCPEGTKQTYKGCE